jgi:hypothetical protein
VLIVSILAMAMVILPTLYPAIIASRLSAPSAKRRWEVPPSVNDEISLLLPFTVSNEEAKATAGYLCDFFESHAESTAGSFMTEHTELTRIATVRGEGYALTFDASLSPYDLGVTQYVEIYAVPSKDDGEHEVYLFLVRQSGDVAAWERLARPFIDELRKRLLAWRTMPPAAKEGFARHGDKEMAAR